MFVRTGSAGSSDEEMIQNFPTLRFRYINHAGKTAVRNVVSPTLFWGQSDFYPDPQWLLNAYDLDKQAWRTFAFSCITILEQNSNSNCDNAAITTGVVE